MANSPLRPESVWQAWPTGPVGFGDHTGWLRVSDAKESVSLAVKGHGGPEVSATTNSTEWVRKTVDFETGPSAACCVVHVRKTSAGGGHAWADNLALPLR